MGAATVDTISNERLILGLGTSTKSIVEQFDLLRVVDKKRYPCFIEHRGHRYKINMEKF